MMQIVKIMSTFQVFFLLQQYTAKQDTGRKYYTASTRKPHKYTAGAADEQRWHDAGFDRFCA